MGENLQLLESNESQKRYLGDIPVFSVFSPSFTEIT
jgi:hypothetical protein